jgi:hypothetical protein
MLFQKPKTTSFEKENTLQNFTRKNPDVHHRLYSWPPHHCWTVLWHTDPVLTLVRVSFNLHLIIIFLPGM